MRPLLCLLALCYYSYTRPLCRGHTAGQLAGALAAVLPAGGGHRLPVGLPARHQVDNIWADGCRDLEQEVTSAVS